MERKTFFTNYFGKAKAGWQKLNKKDFLSSNLATKYGYCTQHRNMYNKCNAKMAKLTNNYTIRFSKQQAESLQKLKDYDVNVSQFIRIAISEKINNE